MLTRGMRVHPGRFPSLVVCVAAAALAAPAGCAEPRNDPPASERRDSGADAAEAGIDLPASADLGAPAPGDGIGGSEDGGDGGGDDGGDDGAAAETSCTPGTTRCATGAAIVEICAEGGVWSVHETCLSICANGACVGKCRPGDRRCTTGPGFETCTAQGEWMAAGACPVVCSGQGQCTTCRPDARRCSADGKSLETCAKDGSAYAATDACAHGCQGERCNLCAPGSKVCSGITLRTCRTDGSGFAEQACKGPASGGQAVCLDGRCDITCAPGRMRVGDACVCPGSTVDCGGACVAAVETIDLPPFNKTCMNPDAGICDPHTVPVTITACRRNVAVTLKADAGHCAPIRLQMLVNGMARGLPSAAIQPGQFSVPLMLGVHGPGAVTLGFQASVVREGCGVGGRLINWGGSARITLTAP